MVFQRMLAPLADKFNQLAENGLLTMARALGLHPPLAAPARVTMALDLAPGLDQTVMLPAGTTFATSSSEPGTSMAFTTLGEYVLHSASLITTGLLPASWHPDHSDAAKQAASFTPLGKGTEVGPEQCLILVFSRPLPGMTCQVSLPLEPGTETGSLKWEAWHTNGWTPCGTNTGTGLSAAPRSPEFAVPVASAHTACVFPATGKLPRHEAISLLRCSPLTGTFTLADDTVPVTVRGWADAVEGELVRGEQLGRSDGTAGQAFRLNRPISTTYRRPYLEAAQDTGTQIWTMVDSFADSQPTDRHFMADAAQGRIRFSPSPQRGSSPPAGSVLRIPLYHSGGGASGNVAPGTITILKNPRPEITAVTNPDAATGGSEPVPAASWYRASPGPTVSLATAQELEQLALLLGLGIAVVRCLPANPQRSSPTVQLNVLPTVRADALDRISSSQLRLTSDAEDAIRRGIGPRLPSGTMLVISSFPITEVSTEVTVRSRTWASSEERKELVRNACAALHRYFCPLPGAGPAGQGWPVGQSAYVGDIHQALAGVAGLESVEQAVFVSASTAVVPDEFGLLCSGHHTIKCPSVGAQNADTVVFTS
ncbi:hypothetical protein [Streptomyces luteireticuli]|uniref:hypothetical protein n=1 Tax=Streptomyces luteireticuli TaxID=173858 RepID=UPI0035579827